MSIVGEAVLTFSIELLVKKLISSELLSFAGREQIHADLKKWEIKLRNIYTVLDDAEDKQITNQFVKKWLVDLQNLAYDVEDILDEFETEALARKLSHEPESGPTTSKARMLIPTCCTNFNLRSLRFNMKMKSEIKGITERLEEIVAQKNELQLLDIPKERSNKVNRSEQRLPTTCLSETHVFGREEDQETIIKLLLKDEANEDGISVIPIVGIGGVGKTTLAQNVYNDARVKGHFDLKAWAFVSDDFDVIRVTKQLISTDGDHSDLNKLQVQLQEKLHRKKFLIVLDDIWNENYDMWTSFISPCRAGLSGSKIVVTTRSDYVSSMVGTVPTHRLNELSFNDCLSIFIYHSLGRKDFNEHQNLKEVGESIVNKCDGLPLAAKTLGGLLRSTDKYEDWEHVLKSDIWDLPQVRGGFIPSLKLSYYYLPPHLKRCFVYCSLLPKDYEFQKEEIILLWMAQGVLQQESSAGEMEDIGDKYFRELQSRSFIQQSSNDSSRYVMHDLINDLAQSVAGKLFFHRIESRMESDKQDDISKNLRHLSYVGGTYDGIKKFEAFSKLKHLRTFLPLRLSSWRESYWMTSKIGNILPKLRRLRVLSLNEYCISELSNAIGDLKHLRHIDLSHSRILCLPESINKLYNLLTLKLEGCQELKKLCDVGHLINLRYLNTSQTMLQEMPLNMGKLTSLRMLSDFVVSYGTGPGLKALKLLKHLQGTLRLSGLKNIHDVFDAKEADLSGKSNLKVLAFEWTSTGDFSSRNVEMEKPVLDMLRPNRKLEQLTIDGFGGMLLPSWLGDTFFSNLVFLRIQYCSNCISLPSIGQLPSLKKLVIRRMAGIKNVGPELYGNGCSRPFPSVETLYLTDMEEWEEWDSYGIGQEVEVFPHLQKLSIKDCPKLQGRLPGHLPSLKRLVIKKCRELQVSIASLPVDCRFEIDGCKQVHPRTDNDFGSLIPMIFPDVHKGQVFLIKRFMQRLSEDERVEMVDYEAPTSFWHSGMSSMQDAKDCLKCYPLYNQNNPIMNLLNEKEAELQLQGLPCICQYLVLDSVCLTKLPQVLLNLGFLRRIFITNCSDLVSFPEANLPSQLRAIDIECCDALECLPDSWMDSTSLECLSVSRCKSLMCLARNQLSPNLKKLLIDNCNNLKALMQEGKDSLSSSTLSIAECSSTTILFSKSELPATLEHIQIRYCENLAYISSSGYLPEALKYLWLESCEILQLLANDMQRLNHLEEISIIDFPSLISFPGGGLPSTNLTSLTIRGCQRLEALPHNMHRLNHLQDFTIESCSSLVSFPAGGLPSTNLTNFQIKNCNKIEDLPNNMHQLNHLQKIGIWLCSSLISFPAGGFPCTNLKDLIIVGCEKLEALPDNMHQLNNLQKIEIRNCSSLVSFPAGGFPCTNLKGLIISDCEKLEALPNGMHQLYHLQRIEISNCSSLVSFPEGGLPSTNLTQLTISNCEKLKGLPDCMHNLSSLRNVSIWNCQGMESFPEDGFPINLESLHISNTLKICKALFKWGLQRLSSLKELYIYKCPDMVCFPPEETGTMLPTSLTILQIRDFPDLKRLSSVIQSLNSLEELSLGNCPKLKYLPKKGLPLSVTILEISRCPLLKQNCEEYGGRYWPMIAYIPYIDID